MMGQRVGAHEDPDRYPVAENPYGQGLSDADLDGADERRSTRGVVVQSPKQAPIKCIWLSSKVYAFIFRCISTSHSSIRSRATANSCASIEPQVLRRLSGGTIRALRDPASE